MKIDRVKEIVNNGVLTDDVKRSMILRVIAKDQNAIPDLLKILSFEREEMKEVLIEINLNLSRAHCYIDSRPETRKEAKDAFSKGFILDEISKFYIKYKGVVTHCFNRFN